MKEITPTELKQLKDNQTDFELIDVREEYEFDEANINGKLIPFGEIIQRASEIPKDKQVVVHCRSGKRSETAIKALEQHFGYTNLYNLQGGIIAYMNEFGS